MSCYYNAVPQILRDIGSSDIHSLHSGTADLTLGAYDVEKNKGKEKTINTFNGAMAQLILCDAEMTALETAEIYLLGPAGSLLDYINTDFDNDGVVDWFERRFFGDISRPAPETHLTLAPLPNQNGWNNTAVVTQH